VQAYRAEGHHRVGLVVNLEPKYAASQSEDDLAATRRADAYMNRQYLDPVFLGRYPDEMRQIFGDAWPQWPQQDFDLIGQKLDFLGVNYYTRSVSKADARALPVRAAPVKQEQATYTETNWEVYPPGLTDTLNWVRTRYGDLPLYITENGAAFPDPPTSDALREDTQRVDYLRSHMRAVHAAIEAGCNVQGYFVWSLFDNLEWSLGFSKRFGIVHVDFATLRRTPKASARFYSTVISSNGAVLA